MEKAQAALILFLLIFLKTSSLHSASKGPEVSAVAGGGASASSRLATSASELLGSPLSGLRITAVSLSPEDSDSGKKASTAEARVYTPGEAARRALCKFAKVTLLGTSAGSAESLKAWREGLDRALGEEVEKIHGCFAALRREADSFIARRSVLEADKYQKEIEYFILRLGVIEQLAILNNRRGGPTVIDEMAAFAKHLIEASVDNEKSKGFQASVSSMLNDGIETFFLKSSQDERYEARRKVRERLDFFKKEVEECSSHEALNVVESRIKAHCYDPAHYLDLRLDGFLFCALHEAIVSKRGHLV